MPTTKRRRTTKKNRDSNEGLGGKVKKGFSAVTEKVKDTWNDIT
jgi:hypothetical protein